MNFILKIKVNIVTLFSSCSQSFFKKLFTARKKLYVASYALLRSLTSIWNVFTCGVCIYENRKILILLHSLWVSICRRINRLYISILKLLSLRNPDDRDMQKIIKSILHVCETWSYTSKERCIMNKFWKQNNVLMKLLWPTERWRKVISLIQR